MEGMNFRIAKLVLWIDRNIVDRFRYVDDILAQYTTTFLQMYLLIGVFSLLMVLAGYPLAVVGLPWLLLAAYRYFY